MHPGLTRKQCAPGDAVLPARGPVERQHRHGGRAAVGVRPGGVLRAQRGGVRHVLVRRLLRRLLEGLPPGHPQGPGCASWRPPARPMPHLGFASYTTATTAPLPEGSNKSRRIDRGLV